MTSQHECSCEQRTTPWQRSHALGVCLAKNLMHLWRVHTAPIQRTVCSLSTCLADTELSVFSAYSTVNVVRTQDASANLAQAREQRCSRPGRQRDNEKGSLSARCSQESRCLFLARLPQILRVQGNAALRLCRTQRAALLLGVQGKPQHFLEGRCALLLRRCRATGCRRAACRSQHAGERSNFRSSAVQLCESMSR